MPTLAFLIDVDNTLLDNDSIKQDFDAHLQLELGQPLTQRFWKLYEEVRNDESVVDIPSTLKLLREQTPLTELDEHTYEHVHSIFDNYPFYNALYSQTLETLKYLGTLGKTVIVSDGDLIFQAEKITNSHIADAVQGRVLLYTHKQQHLDEIQKQYPADHYAMIDDKPDILHDSKTVMGDRLTTVFVRQGKYAKAPLPEGFQPDVTVDSIADLQHFNTSQFFDVKK